MGDLKLWINQDHLIVSDGCFRDGKRESSIVVRDCETERLRNAHQERLGHESKWGNKFVYAGNLNGLDFFFLGSEGFEVHCEVCGKDYMITKEMYRGAKKKH